MEAASKLVSSFLKNTSLNESQRLLDDDSFSADECSESEYSFDEKLLRVKCIFGRTFQMERAILQDKLDQTHPLIEEEDFYFGEISNLQIQTRKLRKEIKKEYENRERLRLKELFEMACSENVEYFSEREKKSIKFLLELKLIRKEQWQDENKERAELTEKIIELNKSTKKRKIDPIENETKRQELEEIHSHNREVFERLKYLMRIIQSLTDQHISTTPPSETTELLKPLQEFTRNIQNTCLDDTETLSKLLTEISKIDI